MTGTNTAPAYINRAANFGAAFLFLGDGDEDASPGLTLRSEEVVEAPAEEQQHAQGREMGSQALLKQPEAGGSRRSEDERQPSGPQLVSAAALALQERAERQRIIVGATKAAKDDKAKEGSLVAEWTRLKVPPTSLP